MIEQFLYCPGGRLLRWPDRGFYEAQQINKVSNTDFVSILKICYPLKDKMVRVIIFIVFITSIHNTYHLYYILCSMYIIHGIS